MTTTTLRPQDTITAQLMRAAETAGGATLATVPGVRVPTTGYVVGCGAAYGTTYTIGAPGARDRAREWVGRSWAQSQRPARFLGSWRHGDTVYLDVVEIIPERAAAVAAGRARGEVAVWSLADGAEILCASDIMLSA